MTGKTSPWQNRPSLISCWEHTASLIDFSGVPNTNIGAPNLWTGDNVNLDLIPFCIPRACRMTRICTIFAFVDGDPDTMPMTILKSVICTEPSFSVEHVENINAQATGELNCTCFDVSIPFDECDIWKPGFNVHLAVTTSIVRATFHFELR